MAENPRDLAPHFFLRPVRVLRTEPRRFHLARRPAKLFRQRQAAFGRHPAVDRELLRAGLFIRQHEKRMRQKNGSRKRDDIRLRQWKFPSVFLVLNYVEKRKVVRLVKILFKIFDYNFERFAQFFFANERMICVPCRMRA